MVPLRGHTEGHAGGAYLHHAQMLAHPRMPPGLAAYQRDRVLETVERSYRRGETIVLMLALLTLATRVQHEPSRDARTSRTLGISLEQGGGMIAVGLSKLAQYCVDLTRELSPTVSVGLLALGLAIAKLIENL